MVAHIVSHLARRGVEMAHHHWQNKEQYVAHLEENAKLYEEAGPDMELHDWEFLPVAFTGLITLLVLWSIHYTIGEVMSSLAMIESPSRAAIIDSKLPPYSDEADFPLEKETMKTAEDTDVEITVIEHKPVTGSIKSMIHHLHRTAGFRARWRGVGVSALYHFLHNMITHLLASFLGFGLVGEAICFVFASVGLARLHMAWTHAMIGQPQSQNRLRLMPARKECRRLLLPALVYAVAQQATIILPVGVAFALGVAPPQLHQLKDTIHMHGCHKQMISIALRMLAVPVTYAVVGLAVLLPASVTLTRIEATLLPEGEEAIVSFDKSAIIADIDVNAKGGSRALFVQAWRSFDRSARLRLIKLYVKLGLAQLAVVFVAAHLMLAEMYVIGGERLHLFFKSAKAQLKLAAIQAHEAHEHVE